MHILVILTGGTIGSTLSQGFISPDDVAKYTLIHTYQKNNGTDVTFSTLAPYTILSENLSAEHLAALAKEVAEALKGDFDGIIVTHGTDTLQYTAAALAYATGNTCKPVVLVSANKPLADPASNGHINFKAAVDFIKQQSGHGVFVAYQNGTAPVTFHNALSVLTHLEADDKVYSLYDDIYATATETDIAVVGTAAPCATLPVKFSSVAPVLTVHLHPGDPFSYSLDTYRAVLLCPYHSGTLPTNTAAFQAFCERAKSANVPVYAVNIPKGDTYASSQLFEELGILPLYDATFVSAYVKLWMQYSE